MDFINWVTDVANLMSGSLTNKKQYRRTIIRTTLTLLKESESMRLIRIKELEKWLIEN